MGIPGVLELGGTKGPRSGDGSQVLKLPSSGCGIGRPEQPPGSSVDFDGSRPTVQKDVYPVVLGSNGEWRMEEEILESEMTTV